MDEAMSQIIQPEEVAKTEIDNSTQQPLDRERTAQSVGKTLFERLATPHDLENLDPARTHIVTTQPGGSQGIDP